MLQESFSTEQSDMQARAVAEARIDAERMLLATQSALDADADLLDPAERMAIDSLVDALKAVRADGDAAVVEAATKALAVGTETFAARRMNRGIQQALSGKNIATV
jgi:molecular chaperone HscA